MAERAPGYTFTNQADEDEPDYTEQYKVFAWRLDALMEAGFDGPTATTLASRRDIDLHQACELAGRAGVDRAAEILL